jgi:hypothetical protein
MSRPSVVGLQINSHCCLALTLDKKFPLGTLFPTSIGER